jgi:hypothetical protein
MSAEAAKPREQEWRAIQARLGELLTRQGLSVPNGRCRVVEQDFGTYEQKVLVSFDDHEEELSADEAEAHSELLPAVWELLSDYSRAWRVTFVVTNKDSGETVPPRGVRMSTNGPEVFPPVEISQEEDRDTRKLYHSFEQLLAAHGTSNAFGEGDYWIVDDSWMPLSHKVCIFNIELLTPQLVDEVQRLLKNKFPACHLWFQIEVTEPGAEVPLPGIRVFPDRIEHDWDRDKLRSIFTSRFRW